MSEQDAGTLAREAVLDCRDGMMERALDRYERYMAAKGAVEALDEGSGFGWSDTVLSELSRERDAALATIEAEIRSAASA